MKRVEDWGPSSSMPVLDLFHGHKPRCSSSIKVALVILDSIIIQNPECYCLAVKELEQRLDRLHWRAALVRGQCAIEQETWYRQIFVWNVSLTAPHNSAPEHYAICMAER